MTIEEVHAIEQVRNDIADMLGVPHAQGFKEALRMIRRNRELRAEIATLRAACERRDI